MVLTVITDEPPVDVDKTCAAFVWSLTPDPQPDGNYRKAAMPFAVDPSTIILPESAFNAALGNPYRRVEPTIRDRAIALTGVANDPSVLGLSGTFEAEPQSFRGNLFIVVRGDAPPANGSVPSGDFYVAAVELAGTTPWLGRARFLSACR